MALPLIPLGIAARYGAKKILKHLTKQAIKKSKGKAAINKAPNKKSTGGFAGGEKSTRAALNLKNKRLSKMMAEVNKKGTNPFPMRVDTRHGGASDAGRSTEGVTKHLLRSVKDSKALFKETYKKSYDLSSKLRNKILRKKRTAADYVNKGKPYKDRKPK